MKNKIFRVLIIFYLSFFVSSFALAADCGWEKPTEETISIQGFQGSYTSQIVKTCSKGVSCPDSDCSQTKPDGYMCCPKSVVTIATEPKFKMPDFVFQTPIPGLAKLSTINCTSTCEISWISEYIFAIYTYGLTIVGVIAVLILMAAGVLWIVSGGDSGKISKAKDMIVGSVTGLLLLVSMSLLLTYINPNLTQQKAISLEVVKAVNFDDTEVISVSETPYGDACAASRKGDFSVCEAAAKENIKPANLVSVEGKEMNSSFAESYKKAMDCVIKQNKGKAIFKINEAWRSPAKQIEYYNIYLRDKQPLASKPCCSNHGSGQAVDVNRADGSKMSWTFNTSSGLTACMNENSLYANLPKEPWHWSPTGK